MEVEDNWQWFDRIHGIGPQSTLDVGIPDINDVHLQLKFQN